MKKEDVDKLLNEKLEYGEHLSPVLPENIKNYLIDINGTVCDDISNEESEGIQKHDTKNIILNIITY